MSETKSLCDLCLDREGCPFNPAPFGVISTCRKYISSASRSKATVDLQELIENREGLIFSEGTGHTFQLLTKAYHFLNHYNIHQELQDEVEELLRLNEIHENTVHLPDRLFEGFNYYASDVFNGGVFNLFNNIAPPGFYFGTLEGDGACYGWFKFEGGDFDE